MFKKKTNLKKIKKVIDRPEEDLDLKMNEIIEAFRENYVPEKGDTKRASYYGRKIADKYAKKVLDTPTVVKGGIYIPEKEWKHVGDKTVRGGFVKPIPINDDYCSSKKVAKLVEKTQKEDVPEFSREDLFLQKLADIIKSSVKSAWDEEDEKDVKSQVLSEKTF